MYRDDVDRRVYLGMLGKVVAEKGWLCLAYCLMNNHVHLLLETPVANLSAGMQRLHSGYAQTFNARHRRAGHVFQGRYGAVRMRSDGQLCLTAAYIARNPVEAGLAERPEQWPWSSYRVSTRSPRPPWLNTDRLLAYFGADRDAAHRRYVELSGSAQT